MPVQLNESSPASTQEIEALESALGLSLPADYKKFLLLHNGSEPADNVFPVGEDNNSGVNQFIPCDQILEQRQFIDHVSSKMIPIAWDGCGNYVILDLEDGGTVYFWDHEIPYNQIELAPGINQFIELLAPFDIDSVQLEEGQVLDVWIDPEFAKEHKL